MGFKTYAEYLASDKWKSFKTKYRASGRSRRCDICHKKPIQLHHKTYARLGEELLDDVVPLCRDCHKNVHGFLANKKWPVENTPHAIKALIKLARKPVAKIDIKAKTPSFLDPETAVLQCLDLLSQGIKHPLVPIHWRPTSDDPSLHTFLKFLRRSQYRLAHPKREKGQWKKWHGSGRTVKIPQPDLNDEHTIHRLIAGGFRVRK